MGKGRGMGRVWREGEGMEEREIGMHEQISPKHNIFGIWGRPLGLPPHAIHF